MSMPTDFDHRAATMAVTKYGIERSFIEDALNAVLRARAVGKAQTLLDVLVSRRLLSSQQATSLTLDLEATPLTSSPQDHSQGEKKSADDRGSAPRNGKSRPAPTGSGRYFSNLGQIRLLRALGHGGMGSVFLGYDQAQNKQVAVKVLSDQLAGSQAGIERFYREAQSGALLDHPNIVRCLNSGHDAATGKHYLVLEFVDGPSALTLLEQRGKLSVGDAVHLAIDIARGLEHAHSRNVVHRDIKPDNILVTLSGVAKISDLGLAKRMDETSHLTAVHQGFGTLYYMPYEQVVNAKAADGRSDIYALGATLYQLLTGQVPFPGDSHMEVAEKKLIGDFTPARSWNGEVPPVLDGILEKMMARDPGRRYQLASELIVDLERANLAAPVPSFTDASIAMQDPVVQKLNVPVLPTVLDIRARNSPPAVQKSNSDIWFLRFRSRDGAWCKAKMTTQKVLDRLGQCQIPLAAEASRQSRGEFLPLAAYAVFREQASAKNVRKQAKAHSTNQPMPEATPPGQASEPLVAGGFHLSWRWLGAGIGVAVMAFLAFIFFRFIS